jgi:hypothetical protein
VTKPEAALSGGHEHTVGSSIYKRVWISTALWPRRGVLPIGKGPILREKILAGDQSLLHSNPRSPGQKTCARLISTSIPNIVIQDFWNLIHS